MSAIYSRRRKPHPWPLGCARAADAAARKDGLPTGARLAIKAALAGRRRRPFASPTWASPEAVHRHCPIFHKPKLNGLGVGIFKIVGEQFEGIDYIGGRYSGTARENADGTISLAIEFEVRPGIGLVQGTAPQDIPYRRRIEQQLPAGFGDGRPLENCVPSGIDGHGQTRLRRFRKSRLGGTVGDDWKFADHLN